MRILSWYTPNGQINIRRARDVESGEADVAEVSANVGQYGNVLDWRWRLLGDLANLQPPSEGATEDDEEHAKSSAQVAYNRAISQRTPT